MSRPSADKPVIGITGGIGAGKSTAAAEFVELGCVLVDADAIGHELLKESSVRQELRARWGERIFTADGSVDRQVLGAAVFGDPVELKGLNEIMHPRIRRRMEQRISQALCDPAARAVVVDAAVLLEAGWDELCTHLIFVKAPQELRASRACAQRGWETADWRRREKSQILLDKKARKCDYTVDSSSTVSYLREQVRQVFYQIVHTANCP